MPLAVPQALWWLGYAWFVMCGLLLLLRSSLAFMAADWAGVNRLVGARSVRDDAADEVAAAVRAPSARHDGDAP